MSGDPEQDYFADGMLFVIARNSSFTLQGPFS
jgi:TolB-like protein